jgi:hypothetical protein
LQDSSDQREWRRRLLSFVQADLAELLVARQGLEYDGGEI